ncbi:glyoxylase-like metal-dependent hydrolase (beta-lactamase superfamily II)/rhodanese-related sulfurtransferase [Oikeobacillus pervagus]|uniref:Glyoxylase-like metal-dependent hydrolase (Beta-lactamase superfamily II)/rhodanese-related sulfurtransferase n=1 Tax=Oikeobacillus pervagus TaxID=1325931 RepID=A0AAJ1T0S6_9BACI|nr:MBL fold metallo-hydrolase [Oikeobacillus pervagus]MDQ0214687.1 glyoxylase-like metal-dependent hydrolase (beta-lactamase superfamily II)/rhodanese-related sulfurtransferase [Oikeobacillus pervagus]
MKALTAAEISKIVMNQERLFILDVRNEADYKDWKIEGKNITSLNKPYFELLDGVEEILPSLPADEKILVVCAKEGSSKFVAEMLEEAGVSEVSYLMGGMKSWSEYLQPVKVYEDENMKVLQFIRVGKGCLSYMVISGEEALVVDPSRFLSVYEQTAKEIGARITHIVDSHLHADHISGGRELAEKTKSEYFLMKSEGAVFDFNGLEDYQEIQFANVHLQVLAVKTPGHTPGSVSFFVNGQLLFSGDTIFVGGLGRPDLGGKVREWAEDLYHTVYNQVAEIADDVIVLPGHYASLDEEKNQSGYIGDTLGNIRSRNDMMNNKEITEFVELVVENAKTSTPPNFEEIVAINRGQLQVDGDKQQELEIGPNRCALHHSH